MIYRFNSFELDTDGLVLSEGNVPVSLEPKVFSLLQFLIENSDRVATKDEIIEHVWDGRIVSDSALTSAVNAARRAVGDNGKDQAIIKTFPRRGVRFIAALEGVAARAGGSDEIAAAFARPAIAVLPFENRSGDPEQEYFTDGLSEDVIAGLSAWRQFPVVGRNSSFTFKGTAVRAQDVARELGVRYIVEGSVRKSGARVRVSAQLIDGSSGHQVWAERYDRELVDVFDLQDEITQRITAILVPEIERAEFEKSSSKPPSSMDAWDHLLHGLSHFNQYTAASLFTARDRFTRAVEADPTYARARAYLAFTYHRELVMNLAEDEKEAARLLLDHAQAAVALDANDADTHWVLGFGHGWNLNIKAMIASAGRALELNPLHIPACHQYGAALMRDGRVEEAIPYLERAVRYSPKDRRRAAFLGGLAHAYLGSAQYRKAHDAVRQAIQVGSDLPARDILLIAALGHLGDAAGCAAARKEFDFPDTVPPDLGLKAGHVIRSQHFIDVVHDGLRKAGIRIEGNGTDIR